MEVTDSLPGLPIRRIHTRWPSGSILDIYASVVALPLAGGIADSVSLVPPIGSKSTRPLKVPAMYTYPAASIAMVLLCSIPMPPILVAHIRSGTCACDCRGNPIRQDSNRGIHSLNLYFCLL